MFRSIMKAKAVVASLACGMVWQVGDGIGGFWNEPLLRSLPMPIRSAITSTIIRANIPNKLVWQFTKNGIVEENSWDEQVSRVKANSPGEAEALAAKLAVNYAVQQHWREVIVEGDAKSVILACVDMISPSSWTWNQALCNISMRSSSFNSMLFRFTPRTCNTSAHKLAKWASSREYLSVLDVCNNFLNQFLSKE
ncbi:hypothetical protein IFM89_019945 [Coptis chinensis]|uniref:RNase H type-1 domain-containing protein n=1 Tax=Coptis chinensis TaxID=261450 RepID=A0A835LM50_9MAGN|nr:hypothetical protein IFM89_019945 [Coptis chinensis]